MKRFFATFESELGEWCDTCGEDEIESFDYIEAFDNQRRRHSTLGQIRPAEPERPAQMSQSVSATCPP